MPVGLGGAAAIGGGISMLGGFVGAGSQHRRQKDLMGIQDKYQRGLNKQGHDLQFDMWNKTNYRAQLEHMKAAGLNPALMYGSAGASGTTGSQGGGSAQGGNAAAFQAMDLSNMMKVKAETELLGAQKDNVDKDTELKGSQVGESGARTEVLREQTRKIGAEYRNINEDTIKKIQETTNLKTLDEWNGMKRDIEMMKRDKQVTGSAIVDLLTQVGLDPINNPGDRIILNTLLTTWFGSTVAKNILQGIGGLKGKQIKNILTGDVIKQ